MVMQATRFLLRAVLAIVLANAPAMGQTPKQLAVSNASVTTSWTLTGYEVVIPDGANPLSGSVGVRYEVIRTVGGEVIARETKTATCSGDACMKELMTAVETSVRSRIAAGDQAAYYTGTRAALYAWLQSAGHIDKAAQ